MSFPLYISFQSLKVSHLYRLDYILQLGRHYEHVNKAVAVSYTESSENLIQHEKFKLEKVKSIFFLMEGREA